MGDHREQRPNKIRKVLQNHTVTVTHINYKTMDHFCRININPDHMNPGGIIKQGVRINADEFSKGAKVLSERAGYRLLTPLSSYAYTNYLNRATEDFQHNGAAGGPGKPVLQINNQSPFRYKSRSYVAVNNATNGQKVFELFAKEVEKEGFAEEVNEADLSFVVNWAGSHVLDMEVNDRLCQETLVKLIRAFEELQPNIKGLGLCVLAEFGRFLLYNVLVDGDSNISGEENEEDGADGLRGYTQLLLVLQSSECETGKSFLSDVLLRIFYGYKHAKHSTVSFDSAKVLLGNGEPVVIDDFCNDAVGRMLLTRGSKATWGRSQIALRNQSITPSANLLLCTNEDIADLKVEGKNSKEVYMKLSVLDLGEQPMKSKGETFNEVMKLAKDLRRVFPSYLGFMLQTNSEYISSDEFSQYKTITEHERFGNLLNNTRKLYEKLGKFCEVESIEKPKTLEDPIDYSCMMNKSELVHKFKTPDELVNILVSQSGLLAITEHEKVKGLAFDFQVLLQFPWFKNSVKIKKDGLDVYQKMKTRRLGSKNDPKKESKRALFLSLDLLREETVEKVKDYIQMSLDDSLEEVEDPIEFLKNQFESEWLESEKRRKEQILMADKFVLSFIVTEFVNQPSLFTCSHCGKNMKSKSGLTRHEKMCKVK